MDGMTYKPYAIFSYLRGYKFGLLICQHDQENLVCNEGQQLILTYVLQRYGVTCRSRHL